MAADAPDDLDTALQAARAAVAAGGADALGPAAHAAARADGSADPSDPRWREAHALWVTALQVAGRMREVLAVASRLEKACEAVGDDDTRFPALRRLSLAGVELGEFGAAIDAAEAAHRLAVSRADPGLVAYALGTLGWCFERLGDPGQAERLMREGVAVARAVGGRPLFAALNNLAVALIGRFHLMRDVGDRDAAGSHQVLREALQAAREAVGMTALRVEAHTDVVATGNLGEILLHLGELDEAERWLRHADGRAARDGLASQHRRIGVNLGEALLARGQAEAALVLLMQRLDATAVDAADEPVTRLRLHHAISRACEALGRPAAALDHLKAYLAVERRRTLQQLDAQARLLVTRREAEQARQDLQHQQRRAADLEREARRDPLTGLVNRREADRLLPVLLAHNETTGTPLAVAMLDLDHFKQVNDAHGHAAGDEVLRRFAVVVSSHLRGDDLLVRWGGEEFLLVLAAAGPVAAQEVVERLRRAVQSEPWSTIAPGLSVTVSIGLAPRTGPATADALLQQADAALYRAKSLGRNRVVVA